MKSFDSIKKQCYEANMMLPKLNLVKFTFGNVSSVDRSASVFAIKPSGVPYEVLSVDDIVVCDFEGNVVEGNKRPSSDTKTHALLYKTWTSIGGICHTHSPYGTSWAQALMDIPILGTTHADSLPYDIPCAPPMSDGYITGDYEYNTGMQIIDCLKERGQSHQVVEMIVVGGHAPFTWGKDAMAAVYNSAILEYCAKMAYITKQINPDVERLKPALVEKHFQRKHGPDAYYGQPKD
jgi:L-ribulose-5-phosphate 4-epimerase